MTAAAGPQGDARAVLVLGMHRSGTSALTRVLSLLGAELPRTLMPAQPDNPAGFWESLPVSRANEQWLQTLGLCWNDPRPLPADWRERIGFEDAVGQATAILTAEFPPGGVWVIKDPRLCRLAPVWIEALARLGVAASALLCLRDPRAIAVSLERRNGIDREDAAYGWALHLLDAEHYSRGLPRALLRFESLLSDWRSALGSALAPLGVGIPDPCDEAAATVDAFLARGGGGGAVVPVEPCLPDPVSACEALLSEPVLAAPERFDALRTEIEARAGTRSAGIPLPAPAPPLRARAGTATRPLVLVHYHLPETRGEPVDGLLRRCLGDAWQAHEGAAAGWVAENVARYLERHSGILALSSATARLPPPRLAGVEVVPLVLLRHPLDRVRELHALERARGTLPRALATGDALRDYVAWRLGQGADRTLRDAQTQRLSCGRPRAEPYDELARAMQVVEDLPRVGLLEYPATWLDALRHELQRLLPGRPLWLPVPSAPRVELAERLAGLREELGEVLFRALQQANARDIALWSAIATRSAIPVP